MEDHLQSLVLGFRALSPVRRGFLFTAAILSALFLLVLLPINRNTQVKHSGSPVVRNPGTVNQEDLPPDDSGFPFSNSKETMVTVPPALVSGAYKAGPMDVAAGAREPRVAYSAELAVATKEFVRARSILEEILERHRGYVAKLRMVGQPAGSILSATLRVPSSEYASALSDLKLIGHVEREEECADEITQQHGDLEARLINAQNTEQRLQKMLQNPPAKGIDTSMFERQLATLRAEIQRMQAERQAFENRAVFSSVFFSMREEVAPTAVSLGAQMRSAAVNGLSDAINNLSAILIFVMNYGPSVLLWAVVLFFPARFLWRRSRLLLARANA